MLRLFLLVTFIALCNAEVQFNCTSDPLPTMDNKCPPKTTKIQDGCCPDDDVYIIGPSTTTAAPTTTTRAPPPPPCKDKINPRTGVSDCPMRVNLCTDPMYNKLMHDQCPKTCGFCNNGGTVSPQTCSDKINPRTGVSDCPMRAYLCTDPTYNKLMHDQCPKTCGFCNNGPTLPPQRCSDKINPTTGVSDCPQNRYLCTNPAYRGLMMDQCPKTCGYC